MLWQKLKNPRQSDRNKTVWNIWVYNKWHIKKNIWVTDGRFFKPDVSGPQTTHSTWKNLHLHGAKWFPSGCQFTMFFPGSNVRHKLLGTLSGIPNPKNGQEFRNINFWLGGSGVCSMGMLENSGKWYKSLYIVSELTQIKVMAQIC